MEQEQVRTRQSSRKAARRIESLAAETNWSLPEVNCLEKEYAFMSASNAAAFASNVRDFFEKHRFAGHAFYVEDRVIVSLRAREEELSDHELEALLTIEALRNMSAARRELAETSIE